MKYVEAPDGWDSAPRPYLFLAGGITNCPDWQSEVVASLSTITRGTVFNPRRESFSIDDPPAAAEQIGWEAWALAEADIIAFWFAKGSDNPITLYEYGWHTARLAFGKRKALSPGKFPQGRLVAITCADHIGRSETPYIVVGCDPEYPRRLDVKIQTEMKFLDVKINDDLDSFIGAVAAAAVNAANVK